MIRKFSLQPMGFHGKQQQAKKDVILSERSESKDLRTKFLQNSWFMRRFFDSAALRSE